MFIVVPAAIGFLRTSTTPFITEVPKGTTLFSALSHAELKSLAACTLIRSYASGESIFSEGAPCVGLYIVSKGRVRIFKTSPKPNETRPEPDGTRDRAAGGRLVRRVFESLGIAIWLAVLMG